MRSDLTDITLVIDRSGSMQEIRSDAEGGINALIERQAKEPGEALLTLVQFDTDYEFVHRGIPVQQSPALRTSTARARRHCWTRLGGLSTKPASAWPR